MLVSELLAQSIAFVRLPNPNDGRKEPSIQFRESRQIVESRGTPVKAWLPVFVDGGYSDGLLMPFGTPDLDTAYSIAHDERI